MTELMPPDGAPVMTTGSSKPSGIVARTFNGTASPGFFVPLMMAMFVTMPLGIAAGEILLGGHTLRHDEIGVGIELVAAAKIARTYQRDLHLG